jgi:hypothetical protein
LSKAMQALDGAFAVGQVGSMVLPLNEPDTLECLLCIKVLEGQDRSDQQARLGDSQRRSPFFSRF